MALLRKFFFRKPPDGLLELSDRVYVFDCCFTTEAWDEENYRVYVGHIFSQLRDQLPDASFLVFNFREGEAQSEMANALSAYDMTVMDYPRQFEGVPVLKMELIHHFLRSSESWLSLGHQNVLLMHCERGGWPVLAFMLAALLIYRKQYSGEQRTLDMVYKQAPHELLHLLSPLNPMPSQLRYLQYVSRRNVVASEWPPLDRALRLDCIILRFIQNFERDGGCRPIFRIYGQGLVAGGDHAPKVLYSTPKRNKLVRTHKQKECELVKIDINCHVQGDVVVECISLNDDMEREEMMFRFMFNTAFIRSNILILNGEEVDMLWDAKDQFPKDFRAEILFSEMDATTSVITRSVSLFEEKEGLPEEAFAKVREIFSHVDWLDLRADAALNVLQQMGASNTAHEKSNTDSQESGEAVILLQLLGTSSNENQKKKKLATLDNNSKGSITSIKIEYLPHSPKKSINIYASEKEAKSQNDKPASVAIDHSLPSQVDNIKPLAHDNPPTESNGVTHLMNQSPAIPDSTLAISPISALETPISSTVSGNVSSNPPSGMPGQTPSRIPPPPLTPPPPPPPSRENLSVRAGPPPPPPPPLPPGHVLGPGKLATVPPPPPSPPLHARQAMGPGKSSSVPPPPPPVPTFSSKNLDAKPQKASSVPSAPPPPAPLLRGASKTPSFSSSNSGKGRLSRTISSKSHKKLKPLHWMKITRAAQGSLWAEAQKYGEASKALEIDMSELENLFSAVLPNSANGKKSIKRGSKSEKVQLIDHRRAYNCEIMLSKVKVPLHVLMSSVLSLEDSALDVDQVENLIKFCPTKEEMELLKGYIGEKGKLGRCEQFFLELMQVPRVESKLSVFSFKMRFHYQVSDLRHSLDVVNSASEDIRNSIKLKRIMQTILSLGNALNQGTARGSAIGFRLDSLLKLTETRARNNKMTLMHYLCKVLADKLPEVLDFSKDLSSLKPASKIQLKILAEEMQAISKGLEKVVQELSTADNDGPISENFCKTLKEFLQCAEAEVRSLTSLYSAVGRTVDALILYFGEDLARCSFEQVISTLLNFVKMFNKAHEENCKQLDLEMKKAAETEKLNLSASHKHSEVTT